jgi:peptidylprolyl isomerase
MQQAAPAVTQGAAGASANGKGGANDDVIARVGGTNISADEIRAYVTALAPRDRAALGQDPNLLSQAVRMMLANRLVLQEVASKKWDQQPNVAEQLERVRENAVVELYLQTVSAPPAGFPSDDDLQKVYDANRGAFLMPRQFDLAQIFVPLAKDADKATEDKAKKSVDDVLRRLKAPGADFAAIANETSETKNGGDLGWVAESQIRPEIRTPVMELAKTAMSEPIKLDDGWHIIKLIDTKASYTRTLPEVREALVQQIRNERATALRRAYLAELLKQHPPVINELALSSLLGDQPSAAR